MIGVKKQPLSLGVACDRGELTYAQAVDVLRFQERYHWLRRARPEALSLAVELGYLKEPQVDPILADLADYKMKKRTCPDPVAKARRRLAFPAPLVPIGILMGLAILVPIVVAGFASGWSLGKMGAAAGLMAGICAGLKHIAPDLRKVEVSIKGIVLPVLLVLPVLSLPFCVYQAYHLWVISTGSPPGAMQGAHWWSWLTAVSWGRLLCGGGVFGGCWAGYLTLADWRLRLLWAYEARIGILRSLIVQTDRWLAGPHEDTRDPHDQVGVILQSTVALLSTNVWARLAGRLAFWNTAAKAISVWYFEPHADNGRFLTVDYKASELPDDKNVREAFEVVARDHTTTLMNVERYEEVVKELKARDRKNWRRLLLNDPTRHEYVSLAGYVFARRVDLVAGDARDCCVFDRSYMDVLTDKLGQSRVRKWLDFRSFAAYPVLGGGTDRSKPRGVLIACRNLRNGLPCEATDVLYPVARLLGQVRDFADDGQSAVDLDGEHADGNETNGEQASGGQPGQSGTCAPGDA